MKSGFRLISNCNYSGGQEIDYLIIDINMGKTIKYNNYHGYRNINKKLQEVHMV